MSDQPAHEILEKLFQTIVKEAETNEEFANEMLAVLSDSLSVDTDGAEVEAKLDRTSEANQKPQKKTKTLPKAEPLDARLRARNKPEQCEEKVEEEPLSSENANAKETFDLKSHNPIILYRNMGEDLMRVKLNKVSAANLKKIGKHYQLRLTSLTKTKSPTKPDIINAIITFAKNYDAQRKGAAG